MTQQLDRAALRDMTLRDPAQRDPRTHINLADRWIYVGCPIRERGIESLSSPGVGRGRDVWHDP